MLQFARLFLLIGIVCLLVGGLLYLAGRFNIPLGRLPGDFRLEWDNVTCLIPLATSILLSILLTLVVNIIARFLNR